MSSQKLADWYPRLASKYHVSQRAIETLTEAIQRSKGEGARFDIVELGGKGIWKPSQGAIVGNGFNEKLNKHATDICEEIVSLIRLYDRDETTIISNLDDTITIPPIILENAPTASSWWPEHLGSTPDLLGNIGTIRFAYFAAPNRLVIQQNLRNRLFDTTGHRISNVSAGRAAGFFNLLVKTDERELGITELKEVSK
jgi:hypothetical protein